MALAETSSSFLHPYVYLTLAGCMLPSLIFRKRMTLSLGNNSGHICVVVLRHLLCSA